MICARPVVATTGRGSSSNPAAVRLWAAGSIQIVADVTGRDGSMASGSHEIRCEADGAARQYFWRRLCEEPMVFWAKWGRNGFPRLGYRPASLLGGG